MILDCDLTDQNESTSGGFAVLVRLGLTSGDYESTRNSEVSIYARHEPRTPRENERLLTVALRSFDDGNDLFVRRLSEH